MSDAPNTPLIPIETIAHALVARPNFKLMDDYWLKDLAKLIDQNAGPASGISVVVLDLSRIHNMRTLALGLLLQISKKCKARHQSLKLAALSPQVREVFSITRLDRVFEFAESVDAAIK